MEPGSATLQADSLPTGLQGKYIKYIKMIQKLTYDSSQCPNIEHFEQHNNIAILNEVKRVGEKELT